MAHNLETEVLDHVLDGAETHPPRQRRGRQAPAGRSVFPPLPGLPHSIAILDSNDAIRTMRSNVLPLPWVAEPPPSEANRLEMAQRTREAENDEAYVVDLLAGAPLRLWPSILWRSQRGGETLRSAFRWVRRLNRSSLTNFQYNRYFALEYMPESFALFVRLTVSRYQKLLRRRDALVKLDRVGEHEEERKALWDKYLKEEGKVFARADAEAGMYGRNGGRGGEQLEDSDEDAADDAADALEHLFDNIVAAAGRYAHVM